MLWGWVDCDYLIFCEQDARDRGNHKFDIILKNNITFTVFQFLTEFLCYQQGHGAAVVYTALCSFKI